MAYKVKLTRPAEDDAYAAFARIHEMAPASADKWLRRLFAAIATLAEMPERCPLIPEADELATRPATCSTANVRANTALSLTSRNNPTKDRVSACCVSGMRTATPLPRRTSKWSRLRQGDTV
jgi:plasmid stabilization system protein ParE